MERLISILLLYCGRLETLNLDRAKTPGFDDRKRVNISNIDPFTIVESREFSRRSKLKFQADRSISFSLIRSFETDDCWISIVENSEKKSIVKQIKDPSPDEQFLLVIDTVACSIAEEMKIAVNHVALIPAGASLEGKQFQNLPASLHSFAPGVSTEEKLPWTDFDIHQKLRKEGSCTWKKWGPLSEEESGLTPAVIHHMSLHPDLADLVALDTYLGNADRSRPNIFFDEKTDSFCAIDMAASFNSLLAKAASYQIDRITKKEIVLGPEELVALNRYRQTLQRLIQKFPPQVICARLEEYATQAGFYPGSVLHTQDVQDRIAYHQRMIQQNYQDTLDLIDLMNFYEFIEGEFCNYLCD